ncbi:TetR/AcrR family transcriptional regulator [Pseudomonas putida]|uniref:TetR/AcrR family transcriptional regulator n=1 Tax=Pseudomonas putida TaxID=303 RepID=UPI0008197055|nr:TetR/AcrR family transcriptional regulator [Pseudomonas putida]OCT24023.1 TetR family transcriptional regulator [Pseudomonas putida]OCT27102.1 TetR family transcriptional regulator [Pseudomonas putida]OCT28386.1 TetR family transcriptional regulator [Pseudomonas putida]OCT38380.1 TetR family transcriptional regulator [Pseudomonas putida]
MPIDAPTGPGRPKDLAKREAILEAAKSLFLSLGYANTSMDAVAAAAGVSKLTVYSHFNDKQTLFGSAVMATCQTQLPDLIFELPEGVPIEDVLLNIARGFQALISSDESVKLTRLIMALGSQDPGLGQFFYEAGPKRVLAEMEALLRCVDERGLLRMENPLRAAEHFFCLIKGAADYRLLLGCAPPLAGEEAEQHVREVVGVFMRAYGIQGVCVEANRR